MNIGNSTGHLNAFSHTEATYTTKQQNCVSCTYEKGAYIIINWLENNRLKTTNSKPTYLRFMRGLQEIHIHFHKYANSQLCQRSHAPSHRSWSNVKALVSWLREGVFSRHIKDLNYVFKYAVWIHKEKLQFKVVAILIPPIFAGWIILTPKDVAVFRISPQKFSESSRSSVLTGKTHNYRVSVVFSGWFLPFSTESYSYTPPPISYTVYDFKKGGTLKQWQFPSLSKIIIRFPQYTAKQVIHFCNRIDLGNWTNVRVPAFLSVEVRVTLTLCHPYSSAQLNWIF